MEPNMKNSALKLLGLITLTLTVACGDNTAAPMIAEIETILLHDYEVEEHYITEIDYRNGNEVDLVSVYSGNTQIGNKSFYYDIDDNVVTRIDYNYESSALNFTMLADYNSDLQLTKLFCPNASPDESIKLGYKQDRLSSLRSSDYNVSHDYNFNGELERSTKDDLEISLRWTDGLIKSLRETLSGDSVKTDFFYDGDRLHDVSTDEFMSFITYDDQGRITEIHTMYLHFPIDVYTTYRYQEGTVAGVQPTPAFTGGDHFGMDGKPLTEIPAITLYGFNIL